MRSLQSINSAREEARYVSRTWSNTKNNDVVGYYHPTPVVESPDDMIGVVVVDPRTISGLRLANVKRSEYERDIEYYKKALRIYNESKTT